MRSSRGIVVLRGFRRPLLPFDLEEEVVRRCVQGEGVAEDLPGDPGDAEDQGSPPGFGAGMSPRRNLPRLSVFTCRDPTPTSIPARGRPSPSDATRPDAT